MVFNFKSDTFMLVVWRGIPRSIRWSIWWNSLWLTDFLALPRRGSKVFLEKVSRNDHSSFPLQGREMAGSSNFKLLMRLSHPFQIWDVFHYFNVHLSDIFTALVIAHEKLNVLRKKLIKRLHHCNSGEVPGHSGTWQTWEESLPHHPAVWLSEQYPSKKFIQAWWKNLVGILLHHCKADLFANIPEHWS